MLQSDSHIQMHNHSVLTETELRAKEGSVPGDTESQLRQRVRDLELDLAQVKLAHVQAQCSNQVSLPGSLRIWR